MSGVYFLYVHAKRFHNLYAVLKRENSWMKRNVAPEGISYPEMNDLAAQVPIGSEGVTILPFGNGAERRIQRLTYLRLMLSLPG